MVVVVACTPSDVTRVRTRLGELGACDARVVSPSAARRLVLATAADEWETYRLVTALRAEGELAVARPADGVRLDAWMERTRPLTFGDRLAVRFAWSEHDLDGLPVQVVLGLGGFGNGHHPTTRLLIEQLLARLRGGERVLDVGCGSGVLGLCSIVLGASSVVAVDNDSGAVEATLRNAELNGVAGRVDATDAPLDAIDGSFDVVVANIGRAALVELAPRLVDVVSPTGWLGCSGFSPSQSSNIVDVLHPLVEVERRTSGDWSAVVLGPLN